MKPFYSLGIALLLSSLAHASPYYSGPRFPAEVSTPVEVHEITCDDGVVINDGATSSDEQQKEKVNLNVRVSGQKFILFKSSDDQVGDPVWKIRLTMITEYPDVKAIDSETKKESSYARGTYIDYNFKLNDLNQKFLTDSFIEGSSTNVKLNDKNEFEDFDSKDVTIQNCKISKTGLMRGYDREPTSAELLDRLSSNYERKQEFIIRGMENGTLIPSLEGKIPPQAFLRSKVLRDLLKSTQEK